MAFFYNPGQWFDQYGKDWWNTDFVRNDLSTEPGMERGVFEEFLARNAIGQDFSRRDQFARAQQGRIEDGFKAALLHDPTLNRIDYYRKATRDLDNAWNSVAPQQRGDFNPGQTRWVRW